MYVYTYMYIYIYIYTFRHRLRGHRPSSASAPRSAAATSIFHVYMLVSNVIMLFNYIFYIGITIQ